MAGVGGEGVECETDTTGLNNWLSCEWFSFDLCALEFSGDGL